ncbi:MAG: GTPase, partial [Rhodocyclaceae bacterium]
MLAEHFSAYTQWRGDVATGIEELRKWLHLNEIGDAQSDLRLQYLLDRLREDKLIVAFVAEFSRGKSELINAVFFAGYGNRILPSSAGRTTMCPTELQWKAGDKPEIRLLPIESRKTNASITELKRYPEEWQIRPLDTSSAESLQQALAQVGETRLVSRAEADQLGFPVDENGDTGLRPDAAGEIEIPRWRHAIIQFPHPLLEQGLVILDTPGLNAIGAEPELTLNLLPNAHAVLFILAADTGVTQSDLAVWREHVNAGRRQRGRLVALNKIDGLWDGLRSEADIEREISGQVASVADTLDIDPSQVYPVSAQKGLVAKVNNDEDLLARSRIVELEEALSTELLPTKRDIVRDNTYGDVNDIVNRSRELLNARLTGLREQLQELTDLRGKNQNVIEYMMRKVRSEKDEFEQGLQKYYAVRSVFSNLSNNLFGHLGLDALRDETRRTREAMLDAAFSRGLREAMKGFFEHLRGNLRKSTDEVGEISKMLDAMYKRFTV